MQLPSTESSIWNGILQPESGDLPQGAAKAFLRLEFSSTDRERMDQLAEKARTGTLTKQERQDAETYNRVAHLLALMQSKARRSLKKRKPS